MSDLLSAARTIQDLLVADRRNIHRHPELAYQEERTAALVASRLQELGIGHRTGVGGTGVVGQIDGAAPGRTVLLRADMDALPILEQSGSAYASEVEGVMHACGHDGHTAMLLAAARLLQERRRSFAGSVRLMFQPAEEQGGRGGALPMIEDGLLEPPVDAAFALHVNGQLTTGQIGLRAGPVMAAADRFTITIRGRGGHASRPHQTVDPIVVAAQITTALQTIVSREVAPADQAVVTIGRLEAGTAFNVIPDSASLYGTVRSFEPRVQDLIERRLAQLAAGIGAAMRAEVEVAYARGYPVTVNHASGVETVRGAVEELLGPHAAVEQEMMMGAEDFSRVLERVPGAMFYLGVRHPSWPEARPSHSSAFDLDEAALPLGAALLAASALRFLQDEQPPRH